MGAGQMKFVIQRVTHASVTVEEKKVGEIEKGFLVLIGIGKQDTEKEADYLVKKMTGLRIFEDEKREDESLLKGCGRKPAFDLPVYSVCQLQSRKQTELYRSGRSGPRRKIIRIYRFGMSEKSGECAEGNLWSPDAGKSVQRRSLYDPA